MSCSLSVALCWIKELPPQELAPSLLIVFICLDNLRFIELEQKISMMIWHTYQCMGVLTSCPSLRIVFMEGRKTYTHSNSNFPFYILRLGYSLFSERVMALSYDLVSLILLFLENQEEILIWLAISVYLLLLFCSVTAFFITVVAVLWS